MLTLPPTLPSPPTPTATASPSRPATLRGCANDRGLLIGAAVSVGPLLGEPAYAETLAREFNALTPENAMKFGPLRPSRDAFDFSAADAIMAFAEGHHMQVRGHTLVWHNQLPGWLTGTHWSREELMTILHEHITTVVGHYRGRVVAWDVVNEAFNDDGTLRDTIWLRTIGPEYIEMAFRWAHEADPQAVLFYNDYNNEGLCAKSDAIHGMVSDLLARGVPIHGVGLQMHTSLDSCTDAQQIAANVARLGALGLQVHVTEMDVRITEPVTEEKLHSQARIYREALGVCQSAPHCTAFVVWGVADRHSWIPSHFPGCGAGLVFDGTYRPKPAAEALREALVGN